MNWTVKPGSRNREVCTAAMPGLLFLVVPAHSPQTQVCSHPETGGLNIP